MVSVFAARLTMTGTGDQDLFVLFLFGGPRGDLVFKHGVSNLHFASLKRKLKELAKKLSGHHLYGFRQIFLILNRFKEEYTLRFLSFTS